MMIRTTDEDRATYGCPEWCRRLDHDAEPVDETHPPVHFGPMFGSVSVQMTGDALQAAVFLGEETGYVENPERMVALARDLLNAAEWAIGAGR